MIYPNLVYAATASVLRRKDKEEELRLLYVAMTRAKYGLFITESRNFDSTKRMDKANNCYTWINNALLSTDKAVVIEMPELMGSVRALSPMERYEQKLKRLVFPRTEQTEKEV